MVVEFIFVEIFTDGSGAQKFRKCPPSTTVSNLKENQALVIKRPPVFHKAWIDEYLREEKKIWEEDNKAGNHKSGFLIWDDAGSGSNSYLSINYNVYAGATQVGLSGCRYPESLHVIDIFLDFPKKGDLVDVVELKFGGQQLKLYYEKLIGETQNQNPYFSSWRSTSLSSKNTQALIAYQPTTASSGASAQTIFFDVSNDGNKFCTVASAPYGSKEIVPWVKSDGSKIKNILYRPAPAYAGTYALVPSVVDANYIGDENPLEMHCFKDVNGKKSSAITGMGIMNSRFVSSSVPAEYKSFTSKVVSPSDIDNPYELPDSPTGESAGFIFGQKVCDEKLFSDKSSKKMIRQNIQKVRLGSRSSGRPENQQCKLPSFYGIGLSESSKLVLGSKTLSRAVIASSYKNPVDNNFIKVIEDNNFDFSISKSYNGHFSGVFRGVGFASATSSSKTISFKTGTLQQGLSNRLTELFVADNGDSPMLIDAIYGPSISKNVITAYDFANIINYKSIAKSYKMIMAANTSQPINATYSRQNALDKFNAGETSAYNPTVNAYAYCDCVSLSPQFTNSDLINISSVTVKPNGNSFSAEKTNVNSLADANIINLPNDVTLPNTSGETPFSYFMGLTSFANSASATITSPVDESKINDIKFNYMSQNSYRDKILIEAQGFPLIIQR